MSLFSSADLGNLPLANQLILITRAAAQSSGFSQMLAAQGAIVREMPTLEIGAPSSWVFLDQAIVSLPRFQWLILTSVNGVEAFFQRLEAIGNTDPQAVAPAQAYLPQLKIAVVGQKTADCLQNYGYTPTFMPDQFVADALVEQFPDPFDRCQILFPRVESGGRDVLVQAFRDKGATIEAVPAYESRCPSHISPEALALIQSQSVQVITFASSKTVVYFCKLLQQALGEAWSQTIAGVVIASIGPQTSHTCREYFGRVDVEAQEYTLDGLTEAIVAYMGQVGQ
jgi:uroporphyrinogen III methyltransferase/synthase